MHPPRDGEDSSFLLIDSLYTQITALSPFFRDEASGQTEVDGLPPSHNGNVSVTMSMLTILEYLDRAGTSPFAAWFRNLDAAAAAKVTTALRRLELGNFSNVKGVGAGVFEYRIDFGPGYRVYFGKDGETVVILGGGTKKRQDRDIATAHARWSAYKKRKSLEK
jgi:putative addiction module killer protein